MGFSPERIEDIRTALGEAVTNAIEHGNRQDASKRVKIDFTKMESSLEIDVTDESNIPFPTDVFTRVPSFIGDRIEGKVPNRGWGAFLIQSMVDELEFRSTGTGNVVRMMVRLDRPSQGAESPTASVK